jgi:hypothetical protein
MHAPIQLISVIIENDNLFWCVPHFNQFIWCKHQFSYWIDAYIKMIEALLVQFDLELGTKSLIQSKIILIICKHRFYGNACRIIRVMGQGYISYRHYSKHQISKPIRVFMNSINMCNNSEFKAHDLSYFSKMAWKKICRKKTMKIISEECKTNTLPILMHQMRISTTQVSSVMLRSKKLEIREKKWAVEWRPECHEIKPNPSKDRAMPEGFQMNL